MNENPVILKRRLSPELEERIKNEEENLAIKDCEEEG